MKKSLQIFRRDYRRIARSPLAVIVLIGAMILPCLYAWVNIGAYADPYGYTSNLKIAVANNDRGTVNEMAGELNAGEKVMDSLKENKSLGWVFTDEKKAVDGVRSGKYYAAIIIPETFSEDLLSITGGELRQPVLEYYLNEKKNAMAPLIMNIGANTLKNEINKNFIDAAVKAVSEVSQSMLDELGIKLESVHQSVTDDLSKVSENLAQYETMVGDMKTFTDGNQEMDENIRSTLSGVADAADSGQTALDEAGRTLETGRSLYGDFSLDLENNLTEGRDYLAGIRYKSDLDFYDLNARTQTVNKKINSAIETLQAVTDRDAEIISSLEALNQDLAFSETNTLLNRMKEENQSNQELLGALRSANQAAGDAADKTLSNAALVQDDITESRSRISSAADLYRNDVKKKLSGELDQVSYFLGVFDGLLEPVDSDIAQMETILVGLDQSMERLNTTLEDTQSTLDGVSDQVDNLKADLDLLQGTETYQKILSASIDGEELSGFLSSPVSVKTKTFFSVRNYGTAMSPFFTNLSIWVGGIVLLALFKLEVDTDEEIRKFRPSEGYIGRGLLFALVGIGQAVIVCLGDLFMLKIQCEHPVLFVLGGMMASFVYVSLIYALGTTLKHVGKALCIVILIFQVPGSSGTYPVEMTSLFFRVIHPFLPFTYGINAMREAEIGIYGHHYALYMVKLSLFLIFAWVLGLGLRPLFINLNVLFDKKLAETDLMICDPAGQEQERFRLMAAMRLLAGRERFQSTVGASIERFEKGYSKRISRSFRLVLIALPVVFLLLMFITGGSKILFLVLWVVSLMALMIFQIIIEYIREHLDRQKRMMELSDQELIQLLNGEASMDDSAKGNAEEGTEDPTDETEDVPVDESGESPVDESLEETADEGTEDPTDEAEKASAEEAVEASESESAGEAADEAEEVPAEEAGEASVGENAGEAADEAEEEPAEEAVEASVGESAGESSEDEAEEALADETEEEQTGRTGKEDGLE